MLAAVSESANGWVAVSKSLNGSVLISKAVNKLAAVIESASGPVSESVNGSTTV